MRALAAIEQHAFVKRFVHCLTWCEQKLHRSLLPSPASHCPTYTALATPAWDCSYHELQPNHASPLLTQTDIAKTAADSMADTSTSGCMIQPLLLFRADVVTDLDEAAEKAEGETEGDAAAAAEQEASFFVRQQGEASAAYAERVFQRVFCFDIERVISMTVSGSLDAPIQDLSWDHLAFP